MSDKSLRTQKGNDTKYENFINRWKQGLETGMRGTTAISRHIRRYLFEKFENSCSICEWSEINPYTGLIPLEVEHVDGNYTNNKEDNLVLLCPNCHSQTSTWRGRNKTKVQVTDADLKTALENSKNIRQALILVGLSPKGDNYKRASKLLGEMKDK